MRKLGAILTGVFLAMPVLQGQEIHDRIDWHWPENPFQWIDHPVAPDGRDQGEGNSPKRLPGLSVGATYLSPVHLAGWLSAAQEKDSASGSASASSPQPPADGLSAADSDSRNDLTLEVAQARREEIEKRGDLEDSQRALILKHYDRSIDNLTQAIEADKRYQKLKLDRENGPTRIAELRAELQQPAPSSEPDYSESASLAELDSFRLADLEKLDDARKKMEAWEARAKERVERRPQMPSIIESTKKQLDDARAAFTPSVVESENPLLYSALRTEHQSQLVMLAAQLELYRMEHLRYDSLNEMFPLQRDLLTRNRNSLERRAERWREILAGARLKESQQQRIDARKQLESTHPALRDIAERNTQLTQLRQEHLQLGGQWKEQQASVNERLETIQRKYQDVQLKIERVGLTTPIGLTLRNYLAYLPDVRIYKKKQHEAEQEFIRLQMEQLQLDDERKGIDDIEARIDRVLSSLGSTDIPDEELRKMTRELLELQRDYLEAILSDFESSLTLLVELDFSYRQLTSLITDFDSYINERVLWIRSAAPMGSDTPEKALRAVSAVASHPQWLPLLESSARELRTYGIWYLVIVLAGLGLTQLGRRIPAAHLSGRAQQAGGRSQVARSLDFGIYETLFAVLLAVGMALAWPSLLWFAGWRLAQSELNLGEALGGGLQFAAVFLWLLGSFYWLCRREGVAEVFWQWPESAVQSLRSNLRLYMVGGVPLSIAFKTVHRLEEGATAETLGQLALIGLCVLLSLILFKLLKPRGAIIGTWMRCTGNSLVYRTRWIWFPVLVSTPLSMAVLAILGYQYTAEQLILRLELTLGLVVVLAIAHTIMRQWLLAAGRRLAIKQARDRRMAEQSNVENPSGSIVPIAETPKLDFSLLNRQVMRLAQVTAAGLFLTGGWAIWDQVFPALQVFGRVELWSTVVSVNDLVETADGPQVQQVSRMEPITRADLMVAAALFVISILASRNLPGLMELSILQRLPIDHGSRNAIKIISGYALLAGGVVIASNLIGLRWNSVQWLVAALTVGLGFGLQEIFANFVSGLIILFERPVRIGDTVTIEGVSGTVTRIQIRATTITDWDRKEFIVPNKEFVTGRLLNWTLSDKTIRVLINVGVAYGTDVPRALQLMKQIADDHPIVLKDPIPVPSFEGFGDSNLNLVLRCFLPSLEQRLQVVTDLNTEIDRQFQKHGIQMAFPQRELHIRTMPTNHSLELDSQSGIQLDTHSGPQIDVAADARVEVTADSRKEFGHSGKTNSLRDPSLPNEDSKAGTLKTQSSKLDHKAA